MCYRFVTEYSECSHTKEELVPCEAVLDGKDPCPPEEVKHQAQTPVPAACDECAEQAHLEAALSKISEDENLRPVPRSAGASHPGELAKTREYFPRCGHYANVTLMDFERGEAEYYDLEREGNCYGCSKAHPGTIERMKAQGLWNEDPWGEMQRVRRTEDLQEEIGLHAESSAAATARRALPEDETMDDGLHESSEQPPPPSYDDLADGHEPGTASKGKGVVGRDSASTSAENLALEPDEAAGESE
jgi:hypothetical protein